MTRYKHLTITAILLLSGCAYDTQSRVDQSVGEQTARPYDQQPPAPAIPGPSVPQPAPAAPAPNDGAGVAPRGGMDVRTVAWLQGEPAPVQLAPSNWRRTSSPPTSSRRRCRRSGRDWTSPFPLRFPGRKPGELNSRRTPQPSSVKSNCCFPPCRPWLPSRCLCRVPAAGLSHFLTSSTSPPSTALNSSRPPPTWKRPAAT